MSHGFMGHHNDINNGTIWLYTLPEHKILGKWKELDQARTALSEIH